ncbi:MAG: PASTA domain-containing protein [Lewinellaceae bacterium]|nr:PASTA domain-containing protein [Lewinellaceae bacterium]
MKVGILFGGPSREREISFASGRTVYDNLDRTLFEPVPLFVDSHRNIILLDWHYIYKGAIRNFYPPRDTQPSSPHHFEIYVESLGELSAEQQDALIRQVGSKVEPEELPGLIDMAFLALHGDYGENGEVQQQLSDLNIPYTGSGVRACQIGADKALLKEIMGVRDFARPRLMALFREEWLQGKPADYYQEAIEKIGFPMAIRPARQGPAIGASIIKEEQGLEGFDLAVNRALFREILPVYEWRDRSKFERSEYVHLITDIREGLGFPIDVSFREETRTLYHPEGLFDYLNQQSAEEAGAEAFILESHHKEEKVLIEAHPEGREFSCVVIQNEDKGPTALPPTEIIRDNQVFDYSFRYMLGLSQKITPVELPEEQIQSIRSECERLFRELGFKAYARIDGVFSNDGQVVFTELKTTTAMLPSSFLFHQAAEIGLNSSQFLTYILATSLQERLAESPENEHYQAMLAQLNKKTEAARAAAPDKRRIAVLFGGNSSERHLSVQTGRNVYEKLASSTSYEPIPFFFNQKGEAHELYQLPLPLMLTDNADEIRERVATFQAHPVIEAIRQECKAIRERFGTPSYRFEPRKYSYDELPEQADGVFIALHGRPGEDGTVQEELEKRGIPYNGSGPRSSAVTIDKYQTLQTLKRNGFTVADQLVMHREVFEQGPEEFYKRIENRFAYPFVAKPVDDGSSLAVKIIKSPEELEAYTRLIFRPPGEEGREARHKLKLGAREEFPRKDEILFENLVGASGARQFLETTIGLLTHYVEGGQVRYELFEPSEMLSIGEIPTLEEKFFAGEEQNITPARFSSKPEDYPAIAEQVKEQGERAARILDIQGYARIDAFVRVYSDNSAEAIFIEANSLPALTPAAVLFQQAAINGYTPFEYIDRIIAFGFERQARKTQELQIQEEEPSPAIDPLRLSKEFKAPSTMPDKKEEKLNFDASSEEKGEAGNRLGATLSSHDHTHSAARPPNGPELTNHLDKNQPFWQHLLARARAAAIEAGRFLSSAVFLRNFGAILAILLLFFFLVTRFLRIYTHHGESLQVPSYIGMDLRDAERKANRQDFKLVVIDSFFDSSKIPNTIYQQDPKPLQRAKQGRTIYVSKYRVLPDSAILPTLVSAGYNYTQYANKLKRLDIKATVKEKVFDSKQEENSILYFYHKGRKITDEMLRRGVKVPKGATLDFVITERLTGTVSVPDLICKRYDAATFLIEGSNLTLGNVFGSVINRESAYVYKQEPEYTPGMQMELGQQIDIYLTETLPPGCPEDLDPSSLDGAEDNNPEDPENENFN